MNSSSEARTIAPESLRRLPNWPDYQITQFLRDVLPYVFVLRLPEGTQVAVEDYLAIAQDQKAHGYFAMLSGRKRNHAAGLPVELMRGHGEGILQAMRDQQGAGLENIALLHDQFDDGV